MSFRIEQTDPLTILSELPNQWAQTCVTSPRRDAPIPYLLAVLDEVHRVLRDDGTLWLALTRGGNSHHLKAAIKDTRWVRRARRTQFQEGSCCSPSSPISSFTHRHQREPVRLKARCVPGIPSRRPGRGCQRCPRPRRAWCVPSPGAAGIPPREVIEWCIVASTVPCACGVCGAPFKHTERCKRWQTTCTHKDGRGRCLVIDPFCSTGETGIVAVRRGRQYLGIDPTRRTPTPPAIDSPRYWSTGDEYGRVDAPAARPADRRTPARCTAMAAVVVILGAVAVLLTLTQPASQALYRPRNTPLSRPPAAAENHMSASASRSEADGRAFPRRLPRLRLLGHTPAGQIEDATPALIRSLHAHPPRVPPAAQARRPRVLSLHLAVALGRRSCGKRSGQRRRADRLRGRARPRIRRRAATRDRSGRPVMRKPSGKVMWWLAAGAGSTGLASARDLRHRRRRAGRELHRLPARQ